MQQLPRVHGPRPLTRSSSGSLQQSQSYPTLESRDGLPQLSNSVAKNVDTEESPKFKQRRDRIKELERLQELEDERDVDKQNGLVSVVLWMNSVCDFY